VAEEKLDGANSAVSFDDDGELILQSRGHVLSGGPRERQFDLFKRWAKAHRGTLSRALGNRYTLYGEWLYARHTIRYDRLPQYFLEFDVFDRDADQFLSTQRRRKLLSSAPVVSVPDFVVMAHRESRSLDAFLQWKLRLQRVQECTPQSGETGHSQIPVSECASSQALGSLSPSSPSQQLLQVSRDHSWSREISSSQRSRNHGRSLRLPTLSSSGNLRFREAETDEGSVPRILTRSTRGCFRTRSSLTCPASTRPSLASKSTLRYLVAMAVS
jgi:RNA ligase-like protein